ncbi:MAG TPA: hypothetical protein VHO25_18775 [Polyangiaceae bacterium]|nr:hypothetical protein [Polyangiaceae bacterium]
MNRQDAIDLLREAGIAEDRIDEDAILIASVIGTAVARAFAERLANKIVAHTSVAREREEGAVDYQAVTCKCGYLALRFNQVPLTECPKCGKSLEDILDAEYLSDEP